MATVRNATTTAHRTAAQRAAQTARVVSPYDGTMPVPTMGPGVPTLTGLAGSGSGLPQVNATNQTALAPNGDINQTVTNENQYVNKYYNIIMPYSQGYGGLGGVVGGWLGIGGTSTAPTFVDPATGVMYVKREGGIIGWLKRLFGGY